MFSCMCGELRTCSCVALSVFGVPLKRCPSKVFRKLDHFNFVGHNELETNEHWHAFTHNKEQYLVFIERVFQRSRKRPFVVTCREFFNIRLRLNIMVNGYFWSSFHKVALQGSV